MSIKKSDKGSNKNDGTSEVEVVLVKDVTIRKKDYKAGDKVGVPASTKARMEKRGLIK